MSSELITLDGKRKYLIQDERERFLAAAKLDRGEVRTRRPASAETQSMR